MLNVLPMPTGTSETNSRGNGHANGRVHPRELEMAKTFSGRLDSLAPSFERPFSTLHEIFEARADARPDAIAVVFGQQQIPYGPHGRRPRNHPVAKLLTPAPKRGGRRAARFVLRHLHVRLHGPAEGCDDRAPQCVSPGLCRGPPFFGASRGPRVSRLLAGVRRVG